MTDVKFRFYVNVLRPDQRQYRQQSIELYPEMDEDSMSGIPLDVVMPLEHKLIANTEDIIQIRLGTVNGDPPEPRPVLTIAGLKYLQDCFDEVFLAESAPTQKEKDWAEDFEPEETTKASPKADSDEWESDGKTSPDKEKWDDTKEEWES